MMLNLILESPKISSAGVHLAWQSGLAGSGQHRGLENVG